MSYTSKSRIQNFLLITIDDSFDTQISEWIASVEKWINNYCGREFETETATYKLYDGNNTSELLVDDILTVTKIEILDQERNVDETIDSTDEYWLYPANESPKWKIVIDSRNAPIGIFPSGHQNIKITGTFGYSATVPADVELAATKMVAAIIRESGTDVTGRIKSESLGDYSVTFADIGKIADRLDVKDSLLKHYRKVNIGG